MNVYCDRIRDEPGLMTEKEKEINFEGFPKSLVNGNKEENSFDLSKTEEFSESLEEHNDFESVQDNDVDDDFVTVNSDEVPQNQSISREVDDDKESIHTVYIVPPNGADNNSRMNEKDRRLGSVPSMFYQ